MKKITAFAYYSVLGHVKVPLIRANNICAGINEKIEIDIPDEWETGESELGEALIKPPGSRFWYLADEIFQICGDNTLCAEWYDRNGGNSHNTKLDWRISRQCL